MKEEKEIIEEKEADDIEESDISFNAFDDIAERFTRDLEALEDQFIDQFEDFY